MFFICNYLIHFVDKQVVQIKSEDALADALAFYFLPIHSRMDFPNFPAY